jgi:hypothetical protein
LLDAYKHCGQLNAIYNYEILLCLLKFNSGLVPSTMFLELLLSILVNA